MENTYFAHGKLLLTGEYVVLDGAKAIGLPTRLGQHLKVTEEKSESNTIQWIALLEDQSIWFKATLDSLTLEVLSSTDVEKAARLANILKTVQQLNPEVFKKNRRYTLETQLDFAQNWGLGSSSTLLVLLSKFANIDAFALSNQTFGGSGYDISCGIMPKIQTYQLYKNQRKLNFVQLPDFIKEHGYFVHLNKKQNSREGIQQYRAVPKSKALVKSISEITEELIKAADLYEFEDLLFVHESLLSSHLGIPPVQEKLFKDYTAGVVKSLGAWGGDFVMVTCENKENLSYFRQKGFNTILHWRDLIVA